MRHLLQCDTLGLRFGLEFFTPISRLNSSRDNRAGMSPKPEMNAGPAMILALGGMLVTNGLLR